MAPGACFVSIKLKVTSETGKTVSGISEITIGENNSKTQYKSSYNNKKNPMSETKTWDYLPYNCNFDLRCVANRSGANRDEKFIKSTWNLKDAKYLYPDTSNVYISQGVIYNKKNDSHEFEYNGEKIIITEGYFDEKGNPYIKILSNDGNETELKLTTDKLINENTTIRLIGSHETVYITGTKISFVNSNEGTIITYGDENANVVNLLNVDNLKGSDNKYTPNGTVLFDVKVDFSGHDNDSSGDMGGSDSDSDSDSDDFDPEIDDNAAELVKISTTGSVVKIYTYDLDEEGHHKKDDKGNDIKKWKLVFVEKKILKEGDWVKIFDKDDNKYYYFQVFRL